MKRSKRKKRRNKNYIFILIIIILLCLGIYFYLNSKKLKVSLKDTNVLLHQEVYNTDFIDRVDNGEITSDRDVVDTSTLGKKTITITTKDKFNRESSYSFDINVIDNEGPTITYKDRLTTTVGNKIDLLKNVSAKDNSNEDIEVKVEGDYDFESQGEYELYYVAKDSSNNETKEKFTLVVNKREEVKPSINNEATSTTEVVIEDKEFTTSKGYKGVTKNGVTYIDGILIVNKTYPLPKNYVPTNTYGKLSGAYSEIKADGIISNAYSAYMEMKSAATLDGFNIYIASGYRSYGYQEGLYNGYVRRNGKADADLGSARPGHSEHQSGYAFDLNTISNSSDNTQTTKWVLSNCYKYGFILRYPKGKTNETGYKYEWWHLRYVGKDLASKLYNNGDWITLENYYGITSEYNY